MTEGGGWNFNAFSSKPPLFGYFTCVCLSTSVNGQAKGYVFSMYLRITTWNLGEMLTAFLIASIDRDFIIPYRNRSLDARG